MRFQLVVACLFLVCSVGYGRAVSSKRLPKFKGDSKLADDYKPCKRTVQVFFDTSNDISAGLYQKLQNFVNNQMFAQFNHYERLALGTYSSYTNRADPGSFNSLTDVQKVVNATEQSKASSDLEILFQSLAQDKIRTTLPQTIVLLVGKLGQNDVKVLDRYAERIKKFAYLSIIGIQDMAVDPSAISKLADFSYYFDLDRSIPDSVQYVIQEAHGCHF